MPFVKAKLFEKKAEQGGGLTGQFLEQFATMPTASATYVGRIVEYTGATDATYTNGYVYKGTLTTTYATTVAFNPQKIACSNADFLTMIQSKFPTTFADIVSGVMTYYVAADLWSFDGKDSEGTVIAHYQQYTDEWEAEGFAFAGPFTDEEEVAFTATTTRTDTYSWSRINVQPQGGTITDVKVSGVSVVSSGVANIPDATVISKGVVYNRQVEQMPSAAGFMLGKIVQYVGASTVGGYTKGHFYESVGTTQQASWAEIQVQETPLAFEQKVTMPVASASDEDKIVQYIGITDSTYTNGYVYKCVSDGAATPTYSWVRIDVQPTSAAVVPATMPTLTVAGWSNNSQTVSVTGVTATNVVFVSPAPASASAYATAGIVCTTQATNSLTFTCTTTPTADITVNVIML